MTKTIHTPDDADELKRLLTEHIQALAHGGEMLRLYGEESDECRDAQRVAADLFRRIQEIRRRAKKYWDA